MNRSASFRAFSLVELLLVVAIIGILLVLTVPSLTNVSRSMSLSRSGQSLSDAIVLAQQQATTLNRRASVRLIKLPDEKGTIAYRGVQPWIVKDDAGTLAPLSRVISFPSSIVITADQTLSPILQSPMSTNGTMPVSGKTCDYVSFTVLPNGGLENVTATNSFLTVVSENDSAKSASTRPANFFTVNINPVTGEVSTFQP